MKATVFFPPADLQRDAWFSSAAPQVIEAYRTGRSITGPKIEFANNLDVERLPDEMFDLSNNPGRQEEREQKYGRFRSLSTGDIVKVDDRAWICKSVGWEEIV